MLRVGRWLGDERRFWTVAAAVLGGSAVLKTLTWPADWPLTQAQLDYSHGFIKRGLAGAVYGALGLNHRRGLTAVFGLELLALLGLLTVFAVRSGVTRRFGSPVVAAMVAGSYAVSFLTHILGYTDLPLGALAVGLLLIRRPEVRFWAALPGVAVALLVHENFLLLFAPVVLLSFVLDGVRRPAERRRCVVSALVLGLLAVGLTLATSLQPNMTDEQADAFEQQVEQRADFNVRDDFFQVLSAGFADNLKGVRLYGLETWRWWIWEGAALCDLLPMLLILLWLGRRVIASGGLQAAERRWVTGLSLLAVGAPLGLHVLGLDGVRWDVWMCVDALLVLGLLCREIEGPVLPLSAAERNAMVLTIAIGMASGHGLFNGAHINAYPFFPEGLKGLILQHDGPLPGF